MSNETVAKVNYCGVEIIYSEDRNRWCFDLDGREHSCERLNLAKKMIDNPPTNKSKFKRFQAYYKGSYGGKFQLVTVTSICEGNSYDRSPHYRIVMSDGKIYKSNWRDLIAKTPENDEKIEKLLANAKERDRLATEYWDIEQSLERVPNPDK